MAEQQLDGAVPGVGDAAESSGTRRAPHRADSSYDLGPASAFSNLAQPADSTTTQLFPSTPALRMHYVS